MFDSEDFMQDCFLPTTPYQQVGKVLKPCPRRGVSCLDLDTIIPQKTVFLSPLKRGVSNGGLL
jgi:hypothetical protein